jgi:hypothetical protein
MEDLTDEEYRAQAAQNIWGGKTELFETPTEKPVELEPEVEKPVEVDKPAEVEIDPAVKAYIESQLGEVNNLKYRLSQAEKRVGSLQNDIQNRKKPEPPPEIKPEPVKNAKWEKLRAEYPEDEDKFNVMEEVFSEASNIDIPDVAKIRAELETDFTTKLSEVQKTFELKLLKSHHKNWESIVAEPEYNTWIVSQPPEIQDKAFNSNDALDAVEVIDQYLLSKKPKEKPAIEKERSERLERATEPPRSGVNQKTKTIADMTDEEYRKVAAAKIFKR